MGIQQNGPHQHCAVAEYFQEDFYAKMQAGTMPTAEEQAAVQELGQKVEANALLKEYLTAQQSLSVYLNDIERIIFKPLQELNN